MMDPGGKVRPATADDIRNMERDAIERLELLSWLSVDQRILEAILAFSKKGLEPGSFVMAVLECRMPDVIARASLNNLKTLPAIFNFCVTFVPAACWGSPEKVAAWMKRFENEGGPYVGAF